MEDDGTDVAKTVKAAEDEEKEVRVTIDAARSLGGEVAEIGDMLESLWNMGVHELEWDLEADIEEGLDGEIRSLAVAILLYRRIFSSSIMGPVGDGNGSAGRSHTRSSIETARCSPSATVPYVIRAKSKAVSVMAMAR